MKFKNKLDFLKYLRNRYYNLIQNSRRIILNQKHKMFILKKFSKYQQTFKTKNS